jgi:hypothetical protein
MYKGQTVFLQLTDHLPRRTFRRLVKHYNADHRVRSFTCWEQFLAMAFAQLTYWESLRAGARGVRRRRAPPTSAPSISPAARRGRSTVARAVRAPNRRAPRHSRTICAHRLCIIKHFVLRTPMRPDLWKPYPSIPEEAMKTDNTAYRSAVGLRSRPNPWFFTYLELLCIMLLCILG